MHGARAAPWQCPCGWMARPQRAIWLRFEGRVHAGCRWLRNRRGANVGNLREWRKPQGSWRGGADIRHRCGCGRHQDERCAELQIWFCVFPAYLYTQEIRRPCRINHGDSHQWQAAKLRLEWLWQVLEVGRTFMDLWCVPRFLGGPQTRLCKATATKASPKN